MININKKKIAFISSTPYQTFVIIKIILSGIFVDCEMHLFYRDFCEQTNRILNKLYDFGFFEAITLFEIPQSKFSFHYIMIDLARAFSPKEYLRIMTKKSYNFDDNFFDYISTTVGNEFELAMFRLYKQSHIFAIDDGVGSYENNPFQNIDYNKIWLLFGNDKRKIKPEFLLINSKKMCRSRISSNVYEIPFEISKNKLKLMNDIFRINEKNFFDYGQYKYVYLTCPFDEISENNRDDVLKTIDLMFKVAVRKHPRDYKNYNFCKQSVFDNYNELWECVCMDDIKDEHVLISICSTAQLMPKLLWNKEPYLVFTVYMFDIYEWNREIIINLIEQIKNLYEHKDKIFEPKTINELINILDSIE